MKINTNAKPYFSKTITQAILYYEEFFLMQARCDAHMPT